VRSSQESCWQADGVLVDDVLDHGRRRSPGGPALITPAGTLDFPTLTDRVHRLAAALAARTAPGDRVAVLSENRAEMVECYYAVPRAGCVLAFANQRLAGPELATLLADADPRVLIVERPLLDRLDDGLAALPALADVVVLGEEASSGYEALLASGDPTWSPAPRHPDRAAWLIHTSGTTGRSKGAVLTHRNVTAGVVTGALGRPVLPDDVYLFPFPLCHVAGYNVLVQHLHGRPVVLPARFDADAFWDDAARHGVTTVSLAPTMLAMLLDHHDGAPAGHSLRTVSYGASAIPDDLLRRAVAELGCGFSQGYGMTELSGNAVFLDAALHRRGIEREPHVLRTCGRPSPLVGVRIVDDDGRDLPAGEAGEIVVRGDQVTVGYWRRPEDTTAAFLPGGWLRTGDIGRFDAEGLLAVVDRKKDLIVTGGENVSSLEVEDVLHRHPAVRAAAVIGLPDPTWGEAITAVVALRSGYVGDDAMADELVAACRAALASFKKPRRVVFVDELPVGPSGKILKADLRLRLG
jgi:acyl-CoA synthetase (AMP-forming)/AMP-acid ligase II